MSVKFFLKIIGLGLFFAAGLWSCTNDPASVVQPEAESASVKISIYTPNSSLPKDTKSNATPDEGKVSRIKVLVLQQSGADFRFRYMVDGLHIASPSDQVTTFDALLTSSDVPLKLLLVANYNDAFDADAIYENMDETTVKQLLIDSFDDDMRGDLPSYGEATLTQLKADQVNPKVEVTMLRAIARVDVVNAIESKISGAFELASVHIYRANDKLRLIPDADAQESLETRVISPTVPFTAGIYDAYKREVETKGDLSILKTYLPESVSVTGANERLTNATCVVVGGYYGGDDQPTYYRIDFDASAVSDITGHPFGQVLRNHKYIFNIVQVNGSGWENPDEAAENEATGIVATMQVWDEMTSEMWFFGNEHYLGISSREVVLNYIEGDEKTEYLQATLPFSIQPLDDSGNPTGTAITTAGEYFDDGFYRLQLVKDQTDGEDVWRLVITSVDENNSGAPYTGKFEVFTDWWTFTVDVKQETFAGMYSNRYVRILTITDLDGDLGTTNGTFGSLSGSATRRMLENKNNFSPSGRVPVAGIITYSLMNTTIASEATEQMYILEKMLETVDVVHLPYMANPSVTASQMIYDWLTAKQNRVLILGTDSEETSENLKDVGIIDFDGEWQEAPAGITHVIGTSYGDEEEAYRFFNGIFGTVPANTPMGMTKSVFGYNDGYKWETTLALLRVVQSDAIVTYMTHGVNLEHGIVYFGESGITSSRGTAMSAACEADGTVTTKFDVLMANLWAWIVERVVVEKNTNSNTNPST